jgi:hypothetical protein
MELTPPNGVARGLCELLAVLAKDEVPSRPGDVNRGVKWRRVDVSAVRLVGLYGT